MSNRTPNILQHPGAAWKLGLGVLFGLFLAGMSASFFNAARLASPVVDTDYYNHGLHYGETQDSSRNAGFGWRLMPVLSGAELQVQVRDAAGTPVSGGVLKFEPLRREQGQPGPLALTESAPGLFRGQRPTSAQGELRGTLRFTRGSGQASRKVVLFF